MNIQLHEYFNHKPTSQLHVFYDDAQPHLCPISVQEGSELRMARMKQIFCSGLSFLAKQQSYNSRSNTKNSKHHNTVVAIERQQ